MDPRRGTVVGQTLIALGVVALATSGRGAGSSSAEPSRARPDLGAARKPRFIPSDGRKTNPRDGAVLLHIPAGEFLMGNDKGRVREGNPPTYEFAEAERPQRRVYLDAYWVYRTPVTVTQYRRFCRRTGRKMPPAPFWGWKASHPVVNVTWEDAAAYCRWAGGRLPTEAEWEKAARGTDGRAFPWGNKWDGSRCAHGTFTELGYPPPARGTEPVASHPKGASPYDVLGMAGNVRQWCADWYDYDYHKRTAARNPIAARKVSWVGEPAMVHVGPRTVRRRHPGRDRPSRPARVVRGSSWDNSFFDSFRAAYRSNAWCEPGQRRNTVGFRVVVPGRR